MKKTFQTLDHLELIERKLSYQINELEDDKKVVERIEDCYQEIFSNLQHSFDEICHFLGNSRKIHIYSEIFDDIKREEFQISENLHDQKDTMNKEYRALEEQEREIFYEKKKLLFEEE